jgi:hypothetical protein
MNYTMTKPCADCPFLKEVADMFTSRRLEEFARGEFPCHKTAEHVEGDETEEGGYVAKPESVHCAGALIYLEKRNRPHQMMRIAERLGLYDRTRLDMTADVR